LPGAEQADPFTVDAGWVVDQLRPGHVGPDRITQVLTNLLGNALLVTSAGGTVRVIARHAGDRGSS
jgi:signal transduction histidine kinase